MPKQKTLRRDYKAEYRRRIANAVAKGLSKSQARGHRKASEGLPSKRKFVKAFNDARLQLGLRLLRTEKNIAKAARHAGISPEKLRAYAVEKGVVAKRGGRWVVRKDIRRRVLIYSGGREHAITIDKFRPASLVGKYMAAVRRFLQSNNRKYLKPFVGKSVKDGNGKNYILETRANVLHRLANSGGSTFEQIYRIVV